MTPEKFKRLQRKFSHPRHIHAWSPKTKLSFQISFVSWYDLCVRNQMCNGIRPVWASCYGRRMGHNIIVVFTCAMKVHTSRIFIPIWTSELPTALYVNTLFPAPIYSFNTFVIFYSEHQASCILETEAPRKWKASRSFDIKFCFNIRSILLKSDVETFRLKTTVYAVVPHYNQRNYFNPLNCC